MEISNLLTSVPIRESLIAQETAKHFHHSWPIRQSRDYRPLHKPTFSSQQVTNTSSGKPPFNLLYHKRKADGDTSFSHDRYVQASASLRECHDVEKMHFYIAQTLMKYFSADHHSLHTRAQHICQAARLIKDKVQHRSRYRAVLSQAAHRAIDAGARPTALQYFDVCLDLMQARPWEEGLDVYYEETLDVFTRAAQLYWHQGHIEKAMQLASQALEATTNPADRAPLWIITSRLLSQQGDLAGAFQASVPAPRP